MPVHQCLVHPSLIAQHRIVPEDPCLRRRADDLSVRLQVHERAVQHILRGQLHRLQQRRELLHILLGQVLVRVEERNPHALRLVEGEIPRRAEIIAPVEMVHPRTHPLRDLRRPVRRARIHHDLLRGNRLRPRQSPPDILLLVFHNQNL